ncbi:Cell wall-associated hydrolase, NlpC family [Butyrivibrio sp. Su6]|uniref:C40 family peptidase n=1 Tax=Butyrivibrio sp. Su6 TaxID=1520810 RepID=UPI00089F4544|nr:SH3 domain-containing C40 family peptidase [Butyrivibrio sp. Su6]SEF78913.1 Cell wall-associated hydrolase, NlpC family [Butyrivibrio sp. Su6]
MKKASKQLMALSVVAAITFSSLSIDAYASSNKVTSVLPQAGITYALGNNQVSLSNLQQSASEEASDAESKEESSVESASSTAEKDIEASSAVTNETPSASTITDNILKDIQNATGAVISNKEGNEGEESEEVSEEESFKSLVIAKVNDYVNVRDLPSEEDGEIIGKLYDKSVGYFIEEENGWYKIKSGSVEGYVKAEYCVTGEDAVELAKEVGTRIATVTTTTLKVRSGPGLDQEVLGLVPIEDELVVEEELDGWVKVSIEEGDGYVSLDYVTLSTEFVEAESKAEEEARLAKEKAAREAANAAAKTGTSKSSGSSSYNAASSYTTATSSIGSAVAQFAQQFVGNPYVYGGTSLTNGADCSGFVMSVYANFGVSLPHSSGADRSVGSAVDGLANAQPGDIICYSGHVAIYIGNGQIVHASTAKTGIKISSADYRTVLAVRRIF